MELRLRNRHRLREREVDELGGRLSEELGISFESKGGIIDVADARDYKVICSEGQTVGLIYEDKPTLTVRGLLKFPATKRYVVVDMGAVRFIYNGADVMSPGIRDACPTIRAGDLVWVCDERHRKPLAVGVALLDAAGMMKREKGKAVRTIHHVGDPLWCLDEPEARG